MARVNYDFEVFCSGCEEKHLRENVKLVYGYGYKCPTCGIKCRTKAKDANQKYIPVNKDAKAETRMEQTC